MLKHQVYFVILLFTGLSMHMFAQQTGCTDPRATNFLPTAIENDGSCIYPITSLNPTFAYELPNAVKETSGLILLRDKLVTFNDSGGAKTLFTLDTVSGQILQQITIGNATNVDWEDITIDEDFIYIGDFGNNSGLRKDLAIYIVDRDAIPFQGHATVNATKIDFYYPDQNTFNATKNHNFDCEAMLAFGDSLYLFSKNRGNGKTKLYSLPKNPGSYAANLLAEFDVRGLITGADINSSSGDIVLTGYTQGSYMPFIWLLFDYQDARFFSGNKRRIELINLVTTQVEGVTFSKDKNVLISAEKSPTFSARVFKFNISEWTDHLSALNEFPSRKVHNLELYGNPSSDNMLRFKTDHKMGQAIRADIYDSTGALVRSIQPELKENSEFAEIRIDDLVAGVYHLSVFTSRRIYTTSFIKL